MWEQDWALLGLEPTTELGAIKKAYAAKLKVTRPDDDAEAYQALRAAYERVQQWAKWQRENADAPPAAADESAAAPLPPLPAADAPPVAATTPAEHLPETEPDIHPRQLVNELELRWRRVGETGLLQAWEGVRQVLDQQPLRRQAEFSAAFARWVLDLPSLPDDFLKALDTHFGWLNDFRTERHLGTELAHALHDALDIRLRPAAVEPAVRALAAPLHGMAALRDTGRGWFGWQLLWLLLDPLLARNQGLLGPAWLARLGLDWDVQRWLKQGQKRGLWLAVGLASVLAMGAGTALSGDAALAFTRTAGWLVVTGVIFVLGLVAGMLIHTGPALTTPQRRLALPLERWRRHSMQPVLGLVWLLFAAWMAWLADNEPTAASGPLALIPGWLYELAAALFGLAGLLAAWPLVPLHGCVVAGLFPLVGSLFFAALGGWLPPLACLLAALAWMLLAAAVHEERVRAEGLAQWPLRPMLNSLALASRWNYGVALLPLAGCSAYVVLGDDPPRVATLFLIWVLGNIATGRLLDKAQAWALKQLPAPAEA